MAKICREKCSDSPVLRVKRKLADDPLEAIVVAFKRSKNEGGSAEDVNVFNQMYRLSATVPSHAQNWGSSHIQNYLSSSSKEHKKTIEELRKEFRVADVKYETRELREKTAGCGSVRSKSTSSSEGMNVENQAPASVIVNNIENKKETITCNGVPLVRFAADLDEHTCCDETEVHDSLPSTALDDDYVFDLYVPRDSCLSSGDFDEIPYITADSDVLFADNDVADFEDFRMYREAHSNKDPYASDDSNAEDNWRNEYPEEDSEFEDRYEFYCQDEGRSEESEEDNFCGYEGGGHRFTRQMQRLGVSDCQSMSDSDETT